jgi:hypothetical protein
MPRIINRPAGNATADAPDVAPAALSSLAPAKDEAAHQSETAVADANSNAPSASGIPVSMTGGKLEASNPLASPSLQVLLSVAAVFLTTMTIYGWVRRGEHSRLAARGPRDLGAVKFGAPAQAKSGPASTSKALTLAGRLSEVSATDGPELPGGLHSALDAEPHGLDARSADWLPKTREEALQVLGAAPDASFEALKKIADGLRQSWHPDLARSESDLNLREQRMKQINVAWDLIQRAA